MKITNFKKFHKNRSLFENAEGMPEEEMIDYTQDMPAQAAQRMAQPRQAQAKDMDKDVALISGVRNGKTAEYKGFKIDYYSETESYAINGKTSFKVGGESKQLATPEEVVSFLADPKNHTQITAQAQKAQAQNVQSQAQAQARKQAQAQSFSAQAQKNKAQAQRMSAVELPKSQAQKSKAQVLPTAQGQMNKNFPPSVQAQAQKMQENVENLNQRLASLKGKTVNQTFKANNPADLLRSIKTSSVAFPTNSKELEEKIMEVQSAISFRQSEMRSTALPEILSQDIEVLEHFLELLQMMQHYFK